MPRILPGFDVDDRRATLQTRCVPANARQSRASLRWPATLTLATFLLQLPFEAALSGRDVSILDLEQMGSAVRAEVMLERLSGGLTNAAIAAFALDYLFVAAWTWWFWRGTARYAARWARRGRGLAVAVRTCVVVAALADSVENALAIAVLSGARGSWPAGVTAAADVKLVTLGAALLTVAIVALAQRTRSHRLAAQER